MKKYELIKEYPLVRKPCIVKKDSNGKYVEQNGFTCTVRAFCKEEIENFPEFWQEIKEPLFVTEDGVEIFDEKTSVFVVSPSNLNILCARENNNERFHNLLYFYEKEKALEWIDQNKPIFSKKQVLDALNETLDDSVYEWDVAMNILKKKLGL